MTTLTYSAEWRQISARIHGLERAAAVHARFLSSNSTSPYGADKDLQRHCASIKTAVEQFRKTFSGKLSVDANAAIDRFLGDAGVQIDGNTAGDAKLVHTIIVKLIAFESELTFCLASTMERVRSAAELAFVHLQRLIVADEDYRKKWQAAAFAKHETHCERLGGVHLLWHGIWAFKADASGGKTDLVYQEPANPETAPVSLGMVLTEWKLGKGDFNTAYKEAKEQAAIYSGGILAGIELASHRYLVVVSKEQFTPPGDLIEGGITYRHINIAVEPTSPSVAAKKLIK